ncbi:MAG: right-handed parallel beta-helix repeat-containing protein, partial [Deltaproteobacteria bacterium]|nr:right-handed parallel beta-helix repeat-containing protein [Deltaproteobacteria bacterium]
GSDTTVRNCHIEGFFDSRLILNGAKRTRLIQNSFIIYQRWGLGIDVTDTQDVVIANNTFIGLTHVMPALMTADAKTQHLTVVGNVIEGAKTAVTGLPATGSHIVKDNVVGHADLESPYHPLFLTGTTQHASALVPGEGTSLDDLPVIGGPTWVPGALQKRSALTARRTVIRVGHGTCGTHTCDIDASAKNEIQQAVWSVWRGGTVEVYPSTQAYAGSAVIGWSITLRGMGNHPEDVVLRNEDELLVPSSYQLWRHGAVLTVLQNQDAKTTIENLSLDVIPGTTQHVKRGVILEYYPDAARTSDHVLRRVSIRSTSGTDNLEQAILLGSRTLTQDVLVQGPFQTCATFGPPYTLSNKYKTPESTAQIINFTCRLKGSDSQAPQAAFEVASVKNTLLANITVELKTPAPLFRAQRRFTGDTGAKALDLPKSFTLNAASVRGITTNFDGFAAGDGTYTLTNLHTLASGDAFFVSSTNSHLATGAQAIDTGVDPATLNSTLKAGTSLDGVIRKGRQIDRGAYEQGK